MRSVSSASLKAIFAVSALLLLSACGSELTGINAPAAVEAGQPFQVSVTQQFLDEEDSFGPTDSPYGALVLGVFVPPGWSANPLANYQGTWDGVPMDLDMVLQSGIPDTNFVEYLIAEEADDQLIEYMSISDCSTVLEEFADEVEGFQFLFFQTTADLYEGPDPQDGDTGTFSFQLTPGNPGVQDEIAAIHGLLIGAEVSDGMETMDVLGCSWYPDVEESESQSTFIPDAESAPFILFGTGATESIPVLGGAMIALLALLLAVAGILVGRRKSDHTG